MVVPKDVRKENLTVSLMANMWGRTTVGQRELQLEMNEVGRLGTPMVVT